MRRLATPQNDAIPKWVGNGYAIVSIDRVALCDSGTKQSKHRYCTALQVREGLCGRLAASSGGGCASKESPYNTPQTVSDN